MKKILVADDEALIRRLICDFLHKNEYVTVEAENGRVALELFNSQRDIALAVLDIMMPEVDGWEVCRKIREKSNIPIILLTARSQEFDQLSGFEAGCDEYVTKPFSPVVLVKRIDALIKRSELASEAAAGDVISFDTLVIDKPAHVVKVDGTPCELTIKEYNILLKLAENPGRTYSREQLLDDIWGIDFSGDARTVDSHVARLRTKLGSWGENHLKTIYGIGYKIEV
ncbi:MAG: response regulator transcription factor [Clostridia bacterium]|jgi:DNA-binding response OmpR family regulator|nr:response regulator transcription factor [Clostridia bacterium]MBQ4245317.1 response regulator transcription factor [Clostridia bacterium]